MTDVVRVAVLLMVVVTGNELTSTVRKVVFVILAIDSVVNEDGLPTSLLTKETGRV